VAQDLSYKLWDRSCYIYTLSYHVSVHELHIAVLPSFRTNVVSRYNGILSSIGELFKIANPLGFNDVSGLRISST